jgi:hypothetical protein
MSVRASLKAPPHQFSKTLCFLSMRFGSLLRATGLQRQLSKCHRRRWFTALGASRAVSRSWSVMSLCINVFSCVSFEPPSVSSEPEHPSSEPKRASSDAPRGSSRCSASFHRPYGCFQRSSVRFQQGSACLQRVLVAIHPPAVSFPMSLAWFQSA